MTKSTPCLTSWQANKSPVGPAPTMTTSVLIVVPMSRSLTSPTRLTKLLRPGGSDRKTCADAHRRLAVAGVNAHLLSRGELRVLLDHVLKTAPAHPRRLGRAHPANLRTAPDADDRERRLVSRHLI